MCLYAYSLVPAEVLAHCPPGARLVDTADLTLDEIIGAMVDADAAGLDVVRLCSGDPAVFSAVAEQARRLDRGRHRLRHHPGRSGVRSGRGRLEPRAHRARRRPDRRPDPDRAAGHPDAAGEDLATLGATGATLVLHLAVQRIEQVVAELTPHYGPGCPAAVVAYASQPGEVVLRGTLGDIAPQVLAAGVKRTAVIIVGRVLAAEGFRDSHLYSAARDRSVPNSS